MRHKKPEYLLTHTPETPLNKMILKPHTQQKVENLITQVININVLSDLNMRADNTILIDGTHGNGKSTLAKAIGYETYNPIYQPRFDQLNEKEVTEVFSFMGENRGALLIERVDRLSDAVQNRITWHMELLRNYAILIMTTYSLEQVDSELAEKTRVRITMESPSNEEIESFITIIEKDTEFEFGLRENSCWNFKTGCSYRDIERFLKGVIKKTRIYEKTHGIDKNKRLISTQHLTQEHVYNRDPALKLKGLPQ